MRHSLLLTPEMAAEVRVALLVYCKLVRQRGGRVGADLTQLLDLLTAARDRQVPTQAASGVASSGTADDGGGMDLLTYTDAARLAGVSRRTIERWVHDGQLDPVRLGPRTVRIRRGDIT